MTAEKPSIDDLRIDRSRTARARPMVAAGAVLVVLAVVAGAAVWWMRERPAAVRVATVTQTGTGASARTAVLNASGYVTARRRATVSSKVTGKVIEVLVEEGMAVRQGQVLARLDPSTATRYLTLAQAELSAAKRALTETEVRLAQARTTLGRTKSLVADGIMTQADLDGAQAEADALDARLSLAREQVAVSERQVAVRENDLADLTIRAPFAGVAISKDAQPGEMVSPVSAGGGFTRTGICTIVDMTSLEIEVDVNESYINRVTPRQRVEALLDAYPDWKIPGTVITTIPAADRQKATVLVRIAFDPSTSPGSPRPLDGPRAVPSIVGRRAASRGDTLDPRILPDMGVKVAFLESAPAAETTELLKAEIVAPRAAIRRDEGNDVVFVVQNETVARRPVRTGQARGDSVVVLAGVAPGELVVIDGPANLRTGSRVVVKER